MKKLLNILAFLLPLSIWGQTVALDTARATDFFVVDFKDNSMTRITKQTDKFRIIKPIVVGSNTSGVTLIPRGNGYFQAVIQIDVFEYPIAKLDSVLNALISNDPLLIAARQDSINAVNKRIAAISALNPILSSQGRGVENPYQALEIDSLKRTVAVDLKRFRDSLKVVDAKVGRVKGKNFKIPANVNIFNMVQSDFENISSLECLNGSTTTLTINLPPPTTEEQAINIFRGKGSLGVVNVTCNGYTINALSSSTATVRLSAKGTYGWSVRLVANGTDSWNQSN
jgi:hypothetical protein